MITEVSLPDSMNWSFFPMLFGSLKEVFKSPGSLHSQGCLCSAHLDPPLIVNPFLLSKNEQSEALRIRLI